MALGRAIGYVDSWAVLYYTQYYGIDARVCGYLGFPLKDLYKFEEMFGASDDGGFEEEDPDEETVEIGDDLLYTGSKTNKSKASSSKKSAGI